MSWFGFPGVEVLGFFLAVSFFTFPFPACVESGTMSVVL